MSDIGEMLKNLKEIFSNQESQFDILSIYKPYDENAHSRILAYLLNPAEKHLQKDKFLYRFLNMVIPKLNECSDLDKTRVVVEKSKNIKNTNRRIDILLLHQEFCIIIENKVKAKDQNKQLEDYYNHISSTYNKKTYVIYLTPNGSLPDESSLSKKKRCDLVSQNQFFAISYKEDIIKWLNNIESIDQKIQKDILQYTKLVEYIVYNTTEQERNMKEKIIKTILDSNLESKELETIKNSFDIILKLQYSKEIFAYLNNYKAQFIIGTYITKDDSSNHIGFDDYQQALEEVLKRDKPSIGVGIKYDNKNHIIFDMYGGDMSRDALWGWIGIVGDIKITKDIENNIRKIGCSDEIFLSEEETDWCISYWTNEKKYSDSNILKNIADDLISIYDKINTTPN